MLKVDISIKPLPRLPAQDCCKLIHNYHDQCRLRAVYAVDGHPMCQRHAALALFNRAMGREE